jgi:hypothetical protein
MSSETRINLIAIGVILAVLAPGGVILFQKKMRPGATAILGQADPVRRVAPYMDPMDLPVHERVVPLKTWRWVERVAEEFGIKRVVLDGKRPVMSEKRGVQVLEVQERGVVLLVWHEPGVLRVDLESSGRKEAGVIERIEDRRVPAEVHQELQEAGYVSPPGRVGVFKVVLPEFRAGEPIRICLRQEDGKETWEDFVILFTSLGNTNK